MANNSEKIGRVTVARVNGEDFPAQGKFKGGKRATAALVYLGEYEGKATIRLWVPGDSPVAGDGGFNVGADGKSAYWTDVFLDDEYEIVRKGQNEDSQAEAAGGAINF